MKYAIIAIILLFSLPAFADDSGWNPLGGTVIGEPPPTTSPPTHWPESSRRHGYSLIMQNNGVIVPAVEMPTSGMKMKMSSKNGVLTIELEKSVSWLQFSKADAIALIKGLITHVNGMAS